MRSRRARTVPAVLALLALVALPPAPLRVPPAAADHLGPAPVTTRVSEGTFGQQGDGESLNPAISGDGRFVAYHSRATTLVPFDTNGYPDIFLTDRVTGETIRASINPSGAQANFGSGEPSLTADGRLLAFYTRASNLVPVDTNAMGDVFMFDRFSRTISLVSTTSTGVQANRESFAPAVTSGGRYVAFESDATNFVPGDVNGFTDIFVKDRETGAIVIASVSNAGVQGNRPSRLATISADGRFVAFSSGAWTLVAGDAADPWGDIFLHERGANTTRRITLDPAGSPTNGQSSAPAISADGRYVAYDSAASNLVAGDANMHRDIFVYDRLLGSTRLVSVSGAGAAGNGDSHAASISAYGRYIGFYSYSSNLVAGDTNGVPDAFVHDMLTGETKRLSASTAGDQGNDESSAPLLSDDGLCAAFPSYATNLVGADTNANWDIFVRDDGCTLVAVPPEQTFGPGISIHAVNPVVTPADPVNTAIGAFVTSARDLSLPGDGIPFALVRSYTSADTATGRLGPGWIDSLDASLAVRPNGDVVLRGEDGQRITFARRPDGTYVGPGGTRSALRAVPGGFDLTRRDQLRYLFDSSGHLTAIGDRNGKGLSLTYAGGLLSEVVDPAGRHIVFTHAAGLLARVELPDGRSVGYGYTSGRLTSATDTRGGATSYTYDAGGRLATITSPGGAVLVSNTYGSDGRVVGQVDANGNQTTFSWDSLTQTSTMTDPRGGRWRDVYRNNMLVRREDPLGNGIEFEWDADLNVVGLTDALGTKWRLTYDAAGNLVGRTAPPPGSEEETYTYDASNNLASITDRLGRTTEFEYDPAGNLVRLVRPDGTAVSYERDAAGRLSGLTDPLGHATRFEYDAAGNLVATVSPLGERVTMTYDASGRRTSLVDPRGNLAGADPDDYRTRYAYDAADHVLQVTDPLGGTVVRSYDADGNVSSLTDPKGRPTSYGYDAASRLVRITTADGGVTALEYDANGSLVRRTNARGKATSYAHDAAGRLVGVTSPIGQQWSFAYDAGGNITGVVTPAGAQTVDPTDGRVAYTYDAFGRLTSIDYSDSTPDVSFTYDAAGNRLSMTDGAGTETYAYDALDRPVSVSRGADAFAYVYDGAGNLVRRTYPDGTAIDYAYDDADRRTSVSVASDTTTYSYDIAGFPIRRELPAGNGGVEERSYDRAGRLVGVRNTRADGTVLSAVTYSLDELGNPSSATTQDGTETYRYDDLDRLIEVCYAPSCAGAADFIRYGYDAVGNRTSEERPSGETTYTYDDADRLVAATGPTGVVPYAYDANGNLIAAGARRFAYDLANRLISDHEGLLASTYSYDGEGKRLRSSASLVLPRLGKLALFTKLLTRETRALWDPNGRLPELALERDGAGGLVRRYVQGNDLVSMTAGGADHFFHYDGLGSVVNVTSAGGVEEWSYAYEPYGTLRRESREAPLAPENPMKFAGEFHDPTGQIHLRHRQYDPAIGRFLQVDPLPARLDIAAGSTYQYAAGNPLVYVDPSGMRTDWREGCPWLGRHLPFIAEDFCRGYHSLSPNWQGIVAATLTAAPVGVVLGIGAEGVIVGAGAGAESAITITERGLLHVVERHTVAGASTAGRSVFLESENVVNLIGQAARNPAVQQAGGNFARVVDAGRVIGIDRATGTATSVYTVITDSAGNLVTAFPGIP